MEYATLKKEVSVNVEIEIKCEECGAELSADVKTDNFGDLFISVERCDCGEG